MQQAKKLHFVRQWKMRELTLDQILKNIEQVPEDKRQAVINHGGGHANHSMFWEIMSEDGGGEPSGEIAEAINNKFGSFVDFNEQVISSATKGFQAFNISGIEPPPLTTSTKSLMGGTTISSASLT